MTHARRSTSLRSEHGFSLIEILVVVLIVGVLAAIALPAFLRQRAKAQDADAKVTAVTALKAMETWGMDHDGFTAATPSGLEGVEPALQGALNLLVSGTSASFTLSVESRSGTAGGGPFVIEQAADSRVTRSCDAPGQGSCPADGSW